MTYCQDCGADNGEGRLACRVCDRDLTREPTGAPCSACAAPLGANAAFCAACGAPVLIAAAMDRPLPSLPDGGLAATMPEWLRAAPETDAVMPPSATNRPPLADATDPAGFISEDDLPTWIHQLVAKEKAGDGAAAGAADQAAAVVKADEPTGSRARPGLGNQVAAGTSAGSARSWLDRADRAASIESLGSTAGTTEPGSAAITSDGGAQPAPAADGASEPEPIPDAAPAVSTAPPAPEPAGTRSLLPTLIVLVLVALAFLIYVLVLG